jgi:hypothetical protein
MTSSRDSHIIELWLQRQVNPHTRGCYRRDVARLLAHVPKPLNRLTLGDLQRFAQSLIEYGWHLSRAPVHWQPSRSCSGSASGCVTFPRTPPRSWRWPCDEKRLAERIVGEDDVKRLVETDAKPRSLALLRSHAGLAAAQNPRNTNIPGAPVPAEPDHYFGSGTKKAILSGGLYSRITLEGGAAARLYSTLYPRWTSENRP